MDPKARDAARFVEDLARWPLRSGVFNPWAQLDEEHDLGAHCPDVRRRQLGHYLATRMGRASFLLVGEALGYQGGHFSGLAMTSERILLGHQRQRGVHPDHVLPGLRPERTSRPDIKPLGFTEPTATIVWGTLLALGLPPDRFVLWNAFAWHPFDPNKGLLSNRRPLAGELADGAAALAGFLALFPGCTVLAVGQVAAQALAALDVPAHPVRHPAQGGAKKFRQQARAFLLPD